MIKLVGYLNQFHKGLVTYGNSQYFINSIPVDQRQALNSKFLRWLISEGKLDTYGYNSTYEFLLDTLFKWNLSEFLLTRLR